MNFPEEGTVQRGSVTIRDFQPEDHPANVQIINLLYPEHPTTVERERFNWEHFDTQKYVRRRFSALDTSGSIVGTAEFNHSPDAYHPQRFWIWIGVHPQWQGKGVGTELYNHLLAQLWELNAIALRTEIRETMTESTAWLLRRGFKELRRGWESRLDLTPFDLSKFADYWGPPSGVTIVTFADELAKDPDAVRTLYELDCAISPDEPRIDPFTRPDFEMYKDRLLNRPGFIPDAIFIAKDGDRYVGLTELFRNDAISDVLNTGFTGVQREYRGRRIAFALKLRALDWAKRHGYREVRTWNNTLNAPMLGINVKLGFVKQPVWITVGKDLGDG